MQVGEWVAFTTQQDGRASIVVDAAGSHCTKPLLGKVIKASLYSRNPRSFPREWRCQMPPDFLEVNLYGKLPGTSYFVHLPSSLRVWAIMILLALPLGFVFVLILSSETGS